MSVAVVAVVARVVVIVLFISFDGFNHEINAAMTAMVVRRPKNIPKKVYNGEQGQHFTQPNLDNI